MRERKRQVRKRAQKVKERFSVKIAKNHWRVPNPPGANPLVAERAPWRSWESCVTGGQQPIGNPYRFNCHFFSTPGNPRATQ